MSATSLPRCRYLYTVLENGVTQKSLRLLEDLRIVEAKAKQRGSFNVKDGQLAGHPVPEKRGAGDGAVVMPEDNSARFQGGDGLEEFGG